VSTIGQANYPALALGYLDYLLEFFFICHTSKVAPTPDIFQQHAKIFSELFPSFFQLQLWHRISR
jgi:hypothetical protein